MHRAWLAAGNVVGFQAVWLASVAGAGAGLAWAGPVAALAFAAATLAWGGRARDDLRRLALARPLGLLLDSAVPVTEGMVAPGNLRVVITRASAYVPGCPDWSSKSSINMKNATSSNYGCALNSNLAAMVADPNDLIKGATTQRDDPSSATIAARLLFNAQP